MELEVDIIVFELWFFLEEVMCVVEWDIGEEEFLTGGGGQAVEWREKRGLWNELGIIVWILSVYSVFACGGRVVL